MIKLKRRLKKKLYKMCKMNLQFWKTLRKFNKINKKRENSLRTQLKRKPL